MSDDMEGTELVYASLVEAHGKMPTVGFDTSNPFFRSRYASLAAIIAASRPVLFECGLALLQWIECDSESLTEKTITRIDKYNNEKTKTVLTVPVRVHNRLVHKSGQSLDFPAAIGLAEADGCSLVQAIGVQSTYLRRYTMSAILRVASDEDTDGNGAHQPSEQSSRPAAAPAPAPKPKVATEQTRTWAIAQLDATDGAPERETLQQFLREVHWIGPAQEPENWQLDTVPTSHAQVDLLRQSLSDYEQTGEAKAPYQPTGQPKPTPAPWERFVVPFGPAKGLELGSLPEDIQQGLWLAVEIQRTRKTKDGVEPLPAATIAQQELFRKMLDQMGQVKEFKK
jgi:hypothetical protein